MMVGVALNLERLGSKFLWQTYPFLMSSSVNQLSLWQDLVVVFLILRVQEYSIVPRLGGSGRNAARFEILLSNQREETLNIIFKRSTHLEALK